MAASRRRFPETRNPAGGDPIGTAGPPQRFFHCPTWACTGVRSMKKMMFALAIAAGAAVAAAAPADARDGCGRGYHRNYNGHCRPNRGPVMVAPGTLIVGNYYNGRGY